MNASNTRQRLTQYAGKNVKALSIAYKMEGLKLVEILHNKHSVMIMSRSYGKRKNDNQLVFITLFS